MALSMVTLTGTYADGSGAPLAGTLRLAPSSPLSAPGGTEMIGQSPVTVTLSDEGTFSVPLVATDSAGVGPAGWCWQVMEQAGAQEPRAWSFLLPFADGAAQDISSLAAISPAPEIGPWLLGPPGT